jgi:hypothetical protein
MRRACHLYRRILLLILFVGSQLTLSGCNDESRTTGTMVQVSDETKAYRKSKIENYKGGAPKGKGQGKIPAGKTK